MFRLSPVVTAALLLLVGSSSASPCKPHYHNNEYHFQHEYGHDAEVSHHSVHGNGVRPSISTGPKPSGWHGHDPAVSHATHDGPVMSSQAHIVSISAGPVDPMPSSKPVHSIEGPISASAGVPVHSAGSAFSHNPVSVGSGLSHHSNNPSSSAPVDISVGPVRPSVVSSSGVSVHHASASHIMVSSIPSVSSVSAASSAASAAIGIRGSHASSDPVAPSSMRSSSEAHGSRSLASGSHSAHPSHGSASAIVSSRPSIGASYSSSVVRSQSASIPTRPSSSAVPSRSVSQVAAPSSSAGFSSRPSAPASISASAHLSSSSGPPIVPSVSIPPTVPSVSIPPDTPPPVQTCDLGTAFGYQASDSVTLDTQSGNGCNRWGWYETPTLAELQSGSTSGTLYVGAGGNNIDNAINVGTWTASADQFGGVTVTYILSAGYFIDEAHIDLDCLPIDTCAPGQYTFNSGALPNVPVYANPVALQYPVCTGGSVAYLIVHASVNYVTTATTCGAPVV